MFHPFRVNCPGENLHISPFGRANREGNVPVSNHLLWLTGLSRFTQWPVSPYR
jgi:hypothetical protein